jgi:DNA invertase Pin-like site-specific DNA recombinase
MVNVAYSYMRFSNSHQASGDSRRRQLAMAEEYAAQHNLTLDKHLSFRDLGVSAFRSKNSKEGALRAFLEAIEHNLVPPQSYLLVESLDRLSRDRILTAQALFLQIVSTGITIVTLTDGRSYSLEGINQNPLDLIVSLVVMMRANEESEMKSRRVRAAFLHWQHGEESIVEVNMRPQRAVANPRRTDRPQFEVGERAAPLPEVAR